MEKDFVGVLEYPVYSNQVNAQCEMPVSKVVEALIDAASRHAEKWGFGYRHLVANNQGWVLARVALEMKRYPRVDETLVVETWVEGINKHFSTRNFRFLDKNGDVLGYARSVWSVIDFTTRESVDLTLYDKIGELVVNVDCPIERPGRIAAVMDENPESYKVRLSDLDINRHLTSSRYIEHLFDRFSLEKMDSERVYRFEIQYLNEVRYDDEVQLLRQDMADGQSLLEMRNKAGVACCKIKCNFITN